MKDWADYVYSKWDKEAYDYEQARIEKLVDLGYCVDEFGDPYVEDWYFYTEYYVNIPEGYDGYCVIETLDEIFMNKTDNFHSEDFKDGPVTFCDNYYYWWKAHYDFEFDPFIGDDGTDKTIDHIIIRAYINNDLTAQICAFLNNSTLIYQMGTFGKPRKMYKEVNISDDDLF